MAFKLAVQSFTRPPVPEVAKLVSTTGDKEQGTDFSGAASLQGRYVLFTSSANNFFDGDGNFTNDVFLKDLTDGTLSRVSVNANDVEANGASTNPQFSPNGAFVLFESVANNLIGDDGNDKSDVFLKNLETKQIVRISTNKDGLEANGDSGAAQFSGNGQYVVFESNATDLLDFQVNGMSQIYRKNIDTDEIDLVSGVFGENGAVAGNGYSYSASVSENGQYVVFVSEATNLVGNYGNERADIFRKDLDTKQIVRVSTAADGSEALRGDSKDPTVSADGRYVVFSSEADNLVANDKNNQSDIFLKDLKNNTIVCVSAGMDGAPASGGESIAPHMTPDGRYITFVSSAANLIVGDKDNAYDVFRKDMATGEILRVTIPLGSTQVDGFSAAPRISPDGRYVVFGSEASNIVTGDANEQSDIFLVDTVKLPDAMAAFEGRHVRATLAVGSASSVSVAWGDGATDRVTPSGGSASFSHIYATAGQKDVTVTLTEGAQTWIVPHKVDLASTTMVRNTVLADKQIGSKNKDTLKGDAFANILKGGLGNDVLTGGTGKDIFVFDTKLNKKTNLDRIVDFSVKDDTIWLDNAIFKKLGKGTELKPGKLASKFFALGSAKDKDDYLVYDNKKGVLYYDADGSGKAKAVEIATLKKGLKLTAADFFVI